MKTTLLIGLDAAQALQNPLPLHCAKILPQRVRELVIGHSGRATKWSLPLFMRHENSPLVSKLGNDGIDVDFSRLIVGGKIILPKGMIPLIIEVLPNGPEMKMDGLKFELFVPKWIDLKSLLV